MYTMKQIEPTRDCSIDLLKKKESGKDNGNTSIKFKPSKNKRNPK